jgi:hypothetical protein
MYAADDQVALGGNNEDNYYAVPTHIWFLPPEEGRYGMALVGYDNYLNPEGAVNDHGLFFDGLSVSGPEIPVPEDRLRYDGNGIMKVMTECATVDCALAFFEKYWVPGQTGQLLIGDRYGNSAIVEPLAIVRKDGPFQVATNFFQSRVPPADRTDTRYLQATTRLQNAESFSVDLLRNTLDVVHQQSDGGAGHPPLHTQYSTIYDLRKGQIHLYYFHDFEHAVTFDLKQELAKGIHAYEISSLFSPSASAQAIQAKYPAQLADLPRTMVDPDLLRQYAGKYRIDSQQPALDSLAYVKSEDGRLFLRNAWMPWVEGIPQSDADFVYQFLDAQNRPHQMTFAFKKDASGQVTGMELAMDDGPKVPADKLPPDHTEMVRLGVYLVLALFLVALGIKALRSKRPRVDIRSDA